MAATASQAHTETRTMLDKEGKYLTFALAREEYGLEILKVREIIGYMEITAANQEQARGIDQVNTAVAQMDKVTQQNAANAEESASASEELSAQAESRKEVVRQLMALVGGTGTKAARSGIRQRPSRALRPGRSTGFPGSGTRGLIQPRPGVPGPPPARGCYTTPSGVTGCGATCGARPPSEWPEPVAQPPSAGYSGASPACQRTSADLLNPPGSWGRPGEKAPRRVSQSA
jgi:hypothetical protein